jgi:hypothetical protein
MSKKVCIKWAFFVAMTGLFVWIHAITRDTDATSSPKYGFAPFSGTVWKTKVKLAIADLRGQLYLLTSSRFDKAHPQYTSNSYMHEFTIIPIGSTVRIGRLIQDNGSWGGVWVEATVDDGTGTKKTVRLDGYLLAPNRFLDPGGSPSKTWDVDSEMLEK